MVIAARALARLFGLRLRRSGRRVYKPGDAPLRLNVDGLNGFAAMMATMKEMGYVEEGEEEEEAAMAEQQQQGAAETAFPETAAPPQPPPTSQLSAAELSAIAAPQPQPPPPAQQPAVDASATHPPSVHAATSSGTAAYGAKRVIAGRPTMRLCSTTVLVPVILAVVMLALIAGAVVAIELYNFRG